MDVFPYEKKKIKAVVVYRRTSLLENLFITFTLVKTILFPQLQVHAPHGDKRETGLSK